MDSIFCFEILDNINSQELKSGSIVKIRLNNKWNNTYKYLYIDKYQNLNVLTVDSLSSSLLSQDNVKFKI